MTRLEKINERIKVMENDINYNSLHGIDNTNLIELLVELLNEKEMLMNEC